MAVVGILFGTVIGLFEHWWLFYDIRRSLRRGEEPLKGVGKIFFWRYMIDAVALLIFSYVTRDGIAITAAAISITVAIKISLIIVYVRKGGRID